MGNFEKKLQTDGTIMAFATYKAKPGKEEALLQLVRRHQPVLLELQLITEKPGFIAKAQDGTLIEVFEWASNAAIGAAHQHPAVTDIWEKMSMVADFTPMSTLAEGQRPFPSFEILN